MAWKIALVRAHDCGQPERITVCELGEISAPADLDGVGLDLATSQRILCDVQHAVETVQERALKDKSALMVNSGGNVAKKIARALSAQILAQENRRLSTDVFAIIYMIFKGFWWTHLGLNQGPAD